MTQRMVMCTKLGREAPGLANLPFDDEIGKEIYENVSEEAWKVWQDDVMIKIINEYRLNMADPEQYASLLEQMRVWLNLPSSSSEESEALELENPERGRGSEEV